MEKDVQKEPLIWMKKERWAERSGKRWTKKLTHIGENHSRWFSNMQQKWQMYQFGVIRLSLNVTSRHRIH